MMDSTNRPDRTLTRKWGRFFPFLSVALATLAFGAVISGGTEPGIAQDAGPFAPLAGNWSGTGAVSFSSSGSRERLRCRAAYQAQDAGNTLALRLRCASDSYNFDLNANLIQLGGSVTGQWMEITRNVTGSLTGSFSGATIQAVASSGPFSANLTLTTRGSKQQVSIRIQGKELTEATITLNRS